MQQFGKNIIAFFLFTVQQSVVTPINFGVGYAERRLYLINLCRFCRSLLILTESWKTISKILLKNRLLASFDFIFHIYDKFGLSLSYKITQEPERHKLHGNALQ